MDIAASHQHDYRTGIIIRFLYLVLCKVEHSLRKRYQDLLKGVIRTFLQLGIFDAADVIVADHIGVSEAALSDF